METPVFEVPDGVPAVADLRFKVLTEHVDHPDLVRLSEMLHKITVNFHDGKCPLPAKDECVKSLISGIDVVVSSELKLCLSWSHVMGEVEGEILVQITARHYEFASPIGYTLQ